MILQIDNTHPDFYKIMGRYFADRKFIKEMDCQLYDNNCAWYLYYNNDTLCGFVSVENRGAYSLIDNLYIFSEHRANGYGNALIDAIKKDTELRLITRNEYAERIFKRHGFSVYGRNGRYRKMRYLPPVGTKS